MNCKDCIDKRIKQLTKLISKFPGSIVNILWKKELESLKNKKDLYKNNKSCCK